MAKTPALVQPCTVIGLCIGYGLVGALPKIWARFPMNITQALLGQSLGITSTSWREASWQAMYSINTVSVAIARSSWSFTIDLLYYRGVWHKWSEQQLYGDTLMGNLFFLENENSLLQMHHVVSYIKKSILHCKRIWSTSTHLSSIAVDSWDSAWSHSDYNSILDRKLK